MPLRDSHEPPNSLNFCRAFVTVCHDTLIKHHTKCSICLQIFTKPPISLRFPDGNVSTGFLQCVNKISSVMCCVEIHQKAPDTDTNVIPGKTDQNAGRTTELNIGPSRSG